MSENYQKKFHKRNSVKEVEEGITLSPKFDENGLIPCVTTDSNTKEVLMLGYMNEEALIKTIEKGEAFYFSRSRQEVWHKGKTSGLIQKINEMQESATKEKAEVELLKIHPDFVDIREDDDFHNWAEEQPQWVQKALYENDDDSRN